MSRFGSLAAMITALPLACAQAQTAPTQRAAEEAMPAGTSRMAGATTLLVEDVLPWGYRSNENVLESLGVAFDTVHSSGFGSVNLDRYATIILASDQSQAFYDALATRVAAIDKWLRTGARTLEVHAAFQSSLHWDFDLPGRVHATWDGQHTNVLTWADDPLTQGLPDEMHGDYASHVRFERPHVVKAHVLVATGDRPRRPVMIDYCVGTGRVIATGQTVEYAYHAGWDFAPALVNMITASTATPGCPS